MGKRRERIISGSDFFFGEGRGVGRDQQSFIVQVTSLGLIREFQIDSRLHFWKRLKLQFNLGLML